MDANNTTLKFEPAKYAEMSVWDVYQIMTTIVAIKQIYNLTCCAEKTGETAVFEWAEEHENRIDAELLAMSRDLAARSDLSADDDDAREMAFKRIDGYVPVHVYEGLRGRKAVA